ncbi:MAG: YkvA family protein [Bacillaceae bacterium]
MLLNKWKEKAHKITENMYVLYGAYKNPKTPWYAKLIAILVVAYAVSPIDLIPDFIPVLGYIDDLILLPIGVWIALLLIPSEIVDESRKTVKERKIVSRGMWVGASFIVFIWGVVGLQLIQSFFS